MPVTHHHIFIRVTLDVALFVGTFFGPWWLMVLAGLTIAIAYGGYEMIAAGIVYDALYSAGGRTFGNTEYPFTALFLLCAAVTILVRRQLTFSHDVEHR